MDPNNNGMGILRDIWADPNNAFRGTYPEGYAGCMKFVQTLIQGCYLGPNIDGKSAVR